MSGARHADDLPKGYHTPPRGAELHESGHPLRRGLSPGRRAVGRRHCRRDATRARCGLAEQNPECTTYEPPSRTGKHEQEHQANRYATAPDISSRPPASAFGTKRSGMDPAQDPASGPAADGSGPYESTSSIGGPVAARTTRLTAPSSRRP
jgi:hypothetical protein